MRFVMSCNGVFFTGPHHLSQSTAVMGNVWTPVSIVLGNVSRRSVIILSSRCWVWTQTSNPPQTTSMSVSVANEHMPLMCVLTLQNLLYELNAFRPPIIRVSDKVMIPQDDHPDINFVGLLIGPRGNTLKCEFFFHLAFHKFCSKDRVENIFENILGAG